MESILDIVNKKADTRVERCYQCGKCASSCPMIKFFDVPPYKIIRLITIGAKDSALSASAIWLCTSCYACMTRCPNDINITKVMDALKEINLQEKAACHEKDILIFHKIFLGEIARLGRINEFRFVGKFKIKALKLFQDLALGLKMFKKGKFVFKAEKINGISGLRKLIR